MSYAIYVGRELTASGHAFLAGYGDEPSSHWLELVAEARHPAGSTITVGTTPAADVPGRLSEIPQAPETARHLRVSYSYYKGTPAPLTNGGLNQYGVAVRDVWSPSRPELVAMTPADQAGLNYSDLCKIVLERARSAREGVELIGELTARHGDVTYGGNSHLIADAEEAWVVIEFAGGKGLWAAERLGPRSIRVSRPGYIGEVPPEGDGGRNYLWSENFISFAAGQGWYDASSGKAFDVNAIYGDGKLRWDGVAWVEGHLAKRAASPEKIGFRDLVYLLRTPRLTGDTAGYGQIVPLHGRCEEDLRMMWHAHVGACAAPFVPVWLGIESVPAEFRQHRYLSDGEAARFVDGRHSEAVSAVPRGVEASRSATEVFKRLLYLAFEHPEPFLAEVHAAWDALETTLENKAEDTAALARLALAAGDRALARRHLTRTVQDELLRALGHAESLARSLDLRRQLQFGIGEAIPPKGPEQIW
ncbi:C69 family dipeptidase [Aestuariivirga sp.]|uniref:C69 family dipeptidase n=1 Tax=Aestuariivirga sp. TaxID=2650926 RepID=UPI00391DA143